MGRFFLAILFLFILDQIQARICNCAYRDGSLFLTAALAEGPPAAQRWPASPFQSHMEDSFRRSAQKELPNVYGGGEWGPYQIFLDLMEERNYQGALSQIDQIVALNRPEFMKALGDKKAMIQRWTASGQTDFDAFISMHNLHLQSYDGIRSRVILELYDADGLRDFKRLTHLSQLLERSDDYDAYALALKEIARSSEASQDEASDALFKMGKRYSTLRNFPEAELAFGEIVSRFPGTKLYYEALFNRGMSEREVGKLDAAVKSFEQLLNSDANDLEPGGNLMELFRNFHHRAQWELARTYFDQHKYIDALSAFQASQIKHPYESGCGTCYDEQKSEFLRWMGLSHDWAGHTREALQYYFALLRTEGEHDDVALRVVNIYHNAQQSELLKKLIKELQSEATHEAEGVSLEYANFIRLPASSVMRIEELRNAESRSDFVSILDFLTSEQNRGCHFSPESSGPNWICMEAARLLALHPDQTVPLMLTRQPPYQRSVGTWLALGMTANPEALSALRSRIVDEENFYSLELLVFALSLAGDRGLETMKGLLPSPHENLATALRRYDQGFYGKNRFAEMFPDTITETTLPETLSELTLADLDDQRTRAVDFLLELKTIFEVILDRWRDPF